MAVPLHYRRTDCLEEMIEAELRRSPCNLQRVEDMRAIINARIERRQRAFEREMRRPPPRETILPPRWREIVNEVCARRKLRPDYVLHGHRFHDAVWCRFEIWFELHSRLGVPKARIGVRTGGYNHTTVIYGIDRWKRHLAEQERALAA